MKFEDIITISGKPGLYKIIKAGKTGYLVEEIIRKKKLVLGSQYKVSFLKEISLYTTSATGSVPIQELYQTLQKDSSLLPDGIGKPGLDLSAALEKLLPDFDREKVYDSDIKKFFKWYEVLTGIDPKMDFKNQEKKESKKDSKKGTSAAKPKTSKVKK